jgi:hypothetical protein
MSAAATKVAVSGPAAIGVKDVKRTGYMTPAPFQIKKSVKPLTSVQGFTLKTASLASKDTRERENSNATQGAASCAKPADKAVAKVPRAGAGSAVVGAGGSALTPKRNVKAPAPAVGALRWHAVRFLSTPFTLSPCSARLLLVPETHSYARHASCAQENAGCARRLQEAEARTSEKRSKSVLAARLQVCVAAGLVKRVRSFAGAMPWRCAVTCRSPQAAFPHDKVAPPR